MDNNPHQIRLAWIKNSDGVPVLCSEARIYRSVAPYGPYATFAEPKTQKIKVFVAIEEVDFPSGCMGTLDQLVRRFGSMTDEQINAIAETQKKEG